MTPSMKVGIAGIVLGLILLAVLPAWAAIAIIVIATSWTTLALNSGPASSNAHLSIAIGGGIGLLLLLNVWGIVWRAQKRLIAWTRASAEEGAAMPAEAARLARWAFLASRVGFWLSFPMLFFMGAASHLPINVRPETNFVLLAVVLGAIILALEINALKGKLGPITSVKGVIHFGFLLTAVMYVAIELIC